MVQRGNVAVDSATASLQKEHGQKPGKFWFISLDLYRWFKSDINQNDFLSKNHWFFLKWYFVNFYRAFVANWLQMSISTALWLPNLGQMNKFEFKLNQKIHFPYRYIVIHISFQRMITSTSCPTLYFKQSLTCENLSLSSVCIVKSIITL